MHKIETGNLIIPAGDRSSLYLAEQFMSEIITYPEGTYSDILMAWYMAERGLREYHPLAPVKITNSMRGGRSSRLRPVKNPVRRLRRGGSNVFGKSNNKFQRLSSSKV